MHPLWRTDHDNNVGLNAPEIDYGYEPDGNWIDLTTVHKGGLFGTDCRMLFPSDGIEGIKRFYLDALVSFGKRGLACQPAIIGIGRHEPGRLKKHFVPNGAIYLTTVGYGTGALLGRGVKRVIDVYWRKELGLAQAVWVLEVENFGPFIVESDMDGNSLFERENAKISKGLAKAYEGTKPAVLKRFGETDDPTDELI